MGLFCCCLYVICYYVVPFSILMSGGLLVQLLGLKLEPFEN